MPNFTDDYGRNVNMITDGEIDIYRFEGIVIEFPTGTPLERVLYTIHGMGPQRTSPSPPPTEVIPNDPGT